MVAKPWQERTIWPKISIFFHLKLAATFRCLRCGEACWALEEGLYDVNRGGPGLYEEIQLLLLP